MIAFSSIMFGLGLLFIAGLSLLCGTKGSTRCAATMVANWASCMAFVLLTGNYTPWGWFWTMDLISAAVITMKPVSRWQAGLAYIYMGQLGLHGLFAITGGDPSRYLSWLNGLLIIQMLLVLTWTGGHGLYRIRRAYRWRSLRFVRISGEADR